MEQILPGVSIKVLSEGLIIPGQISISTIGMVGTANMGPVGEPTIIGSLADARQVFGTADTYNSFNPGDELSLIRALELAYAHGAADVIAVRVDNTVPGTPPTGGAARATYDVASAGGVCCTLLARTPGTWGNDIAINISAATENAVIREEEHPGGAAVTLNHAPIVVSARNRISVVADGSTVPTQLEVVTAAPAAGQVQVDVALGHLVFFGGEEPGDSDKVVATYVVDKASARAVKLRQGAFEESYTIVDGTHLGEELTDSQLAELDADAANPNIGEPPTPFSTPTEFRPFGSGTNTAGTNGAQSANYRAGFSALLNEPAHIIVAAGQSHLDIGADLIGHVTEASSDLNKRERIGVVGSALGEALDDILGHSLADERIVFVAPGIVATDPISGAQVTLPGAYAAAAIAGLIAGFPLNRSLTNKTLAVAGLEETYNQAQLRQLVLARVLALESRLGFRTVKGITTATNTAFAQITTRRIVDYAKFGVRSAANPYIGLLNNDRVRAALKSTINGFLSEMVEDEELVSYTLDVFASRSDEIRGIARVTMVLRPTFSIDYIKVTMFLE